MTAHPSSGNQAEQDSNTMRSLVLTVAGLCGLMVVLIVASRIIAG